jgi:UDP-2-acetamido-3-amino-2,3-dideoxy-glucuronate N-acetyltransferase
MPNKDDVFIHSSSYVDEGAIIGPGTKVWHFCHVMSGTEIGANCNLGQNVFVGSGVKIGDNVKIQNNVSVYTGVIVEDEAFLGPSMVFTNVDTPRSLVNRKDEFQTTLVKRGATIGANATVVCGVTLGVYAFVGAGSVVTRDVPDYGLVFGNPSSPSWLDVCLR